MLKLNIPRTRENVEALFLIIKVKEEKNGFRKILKCNFAELYSRTTELSNSGLCLCERQKSKEVNDAEYVFEEKISQKILFTY